LLGVNDGARTRDILDHNQVLYQLSYAHHGLQNSCELWEPTGKSNRSQVLICQSGYEVELLVTAATAVAPVRDPEWRWAISLAAALVGPGGGTKTASR
jgi:hypothetical protein